MSHKAPFHTSSSPPPQNTDSNKTSNLRSRILESQVITPVNRDWRRPFQKYGTDQIKYLEKKICENFYNIILGNNVKTSTDIFKANLKILSPHDLNFLADYYYSKLISEKNCRSKEFNCEIIWKLFSDRKTPLIKSFYDRLKSLLNHDFANPIKKEIRAKFRNTNVDSDQNNFFKELITPYLEHEDDLNTSFARLSHFSSPPTLPTRPSSARPQIYNKPRSSSSILSASTLSLSSPTLLPKNSEFSFTEESTKIDLDKIDLFIFSDKKDESSLIKYKEFAQELLDFIIESSSIDNATSLKHRGAIDKHLLNRIQIKIAESKSPEELKKLLQLYDTLQVNDALQEKQSKGIFSRKLISPSIGQPSLVIQAKRIRANKINRSIDRAIELFNKIAKKVSVSEESLQSQSDRFLKILTDKDKAVNLLARRDTSEKLTEFYKSRQHQSDAGR